MRRPPLGQHFLRDGRVVADILAAAALRPVERVLEVGPGEGVLTQPMCAAVQPGGAVVAIEQDRLLARTLPSWPGLQVVEGDAVRVDLAALGRFDAIVANLPYLISGPITAAFLDLLAAPATAWRRAVLMYQQEFALRLLARPSTADYGRLTVHAARRCRVTKVRAVSAGAFDPPPRVESMVVRLDPHPAPPFAVADEALWRATVDGTFQRRRKQLRNSLPAAVGGLGVPFAAAIAVLDALGWGDRRPENLAPAEFARLVDELHGAARPGAA